MATQPAVETRPSARARTLVQGGYDLHVHIAPDVPPRRVDDVTLACLLERCLSTPLSEKTTWKHVFGGVRAVGVEHTLFASDCGNPDYPPVEDGLALWADRLLDAGFDEDEVREVIVGRSRRLARQPSG